MQGARIIVVEDEPLTRGAIAARLTEEGYSVREASDAVACRGLVSRETPALVILDIGLPGEDGLSLARELRALGEIELIVVTARAAPEDRILALDLGADDYMIKPIHLGELAARVRARLRRRKAASTVRFGAGWRIDLNRRALINPELQDVCVSRGEFALLAALVEAEGKIVTRERLARAIARDGEGDIRSVDALVSRLRKKLGDREAIVTAPGFGYRLGSDFPGAEHSGASEA